MSTITGVNDFSRACIRVLGLKPDEVRRIIIDMNIEGPMLVYVEMYGTDRFYEITPVLEGAKLEILYKKE